MQYGKRCFVEHTAVPVKDMDWHLRFFKEALGMEVARILLDDEGQPKNVWFKEGLQLTTLFDHTQTPWQTGHLGIVAQDLAAMEEAIYSWAGTKTVAGKPKNWIELPEGLQLELFNDEIGAVEKVLAQPKR